MRRLLHATAAAALACLAAPAAAQSFEQDVAYCGNSDGTHSPDLIIGGCTALIQSGRLGQEALALAFNNRGIAQRRAGNLEAAIADHDEAIRLAPREAPYFRHRGLARQYANQEQPALADYSEAIRLNPRDARAFSLRGNAYEQVDDDVRALADYRQAVSLDPLQAEARAAICRLQGATGPASPEVTAGCATEDDDASREAAARAAYCRLMTSISAGTAEARAACRPANPDGR